MGKYIRQFATAAEQAAAPEINPAVDWIKETDEVVYTPYEPPFTGKVKLTYSDGSVYTAACDSSKMLYRTETTPSGYEFSACTDVVVGDCVRDIGFAYQSSFSGFSSLSSVTLADSVQYIYDKSFYECGNLVNVTLGSGVAYITNNAFDSCGSLTGITIPDTITSIGLSAFYNCSSLTAITVNATTPPTLGNYAFNNTNNCPIYVPAESVDTYKAAQVWSTYANRIQAIPTT